MEKCKLFKEVNYNEGKKDEEDWRFREVVVKRGDELVNMTGSYNPK